MWAEKTAPEAGTFRFVLFRPDWNPEIRYEERNYGEVRQSRCVQWPAHVPLPARPPGRVATWLPREENRTTCAMFVNDAHLRTRMVKMGWIDVTAQWNTPVPAPRAAPVVVGLGAPVAPMAPARSTTKRAGA